MKTQRCAIVSDSAFGDVPSERHRAAQPTSQRLHTEQIIRYQGDTFVSGSRYWRCDLLHRTPLIDRSRAQTYPELLCIYNMLFMAGYNPRRP